MGDDRVQMLKTAIADLEAAQRLRKDKRVCEREVACAVADRRDTVYEILRLLFPQVTVEMCRTCLKFGKHTAGNCLLEKARCARCGDDNDHDEKACSVVCCRCGEMDKDATHHDCPYYRREFVRLIFTKYFQLSEKDTKNLLNNVAILKSVLIRAGVSEQEVVKALGC